MAWASHGEGQEANLAVFSLNKILWFGVKELAQRSGALAALVEDLNLVLSIILATGHPAPSSGLPLTPALTSAHTYIILK